MQMTAFILIGLVIILARISNRAPNRVQPAWSQHLKGWQKIFGLAGFIIALLIVMNPELLALGLLGDAAFFDLLVFALSLQFQFVAFRALRCVRDASLTALAFIIRGVRRDLAMIAFTLAPLGDLALKIRKVANKISCAA